MMTFYSRPSLTPPTIVYGNEMPDLKRSQPCPALVSSWKVGTEDNGLAPVELRSSPNWELCSGAQTLLGLAQTEEERFLVQMYLEHKFLDEATWRKELVEAWNANWWRVKEDLFGPTQRQRFERMLWATLRFPALIPQVWLNWLYATSDEYAKKLDENPSRVDFVGFWRGDGYIIEIDGPSHYADYDGQSYAISEKMYARNLKIERSLKRAGWVVTRVGRSEVREAIDHEFEAYFGAIDVLKILPFWPNDGYPSRPTVSDLGLTEIDPLFVNADDDIPF